MPVYRPDGTTQHEIRKKYRMNASETTAHQVQKEYRYDGTTAHNVYTASIILTNQLSSIWTESHAVDAGWSDYSRSRSYSTVPGHKYWIQDVTGGWGGRSGGCSWNYGTGFHTASGTSMTLTFHWTGSTGAGQSAGWNGSLQMFVDVTEYEEMLGRTITNADMFKFGIFYNSKEIEV